MKQAKRAIKFIHRSVLAGSAEELRCFIDEADLPDPAYVEVKFNWSHGHSTPKLVLTHDHKTGQVDHGLWDPRPENYRIAWMIRNEDFFILRWGDPDFIRSHITENSHDYVGGYFVGSEGYIPAKDYSHKGDPHKTWDYAFEKQWLFYLLWGRLLYNPQTPDAVFAAAFETRYGEGIGQQLFRAQGLASRTPLRLASFYAATWDFTLYCEGFLAPRKSCGLFDGASPFISIDELIHHETLDPSYISIPDYVTHLTDGVTTPDGKVTPLELAEMSRDDGREVLRIAESLTPLAKRNGGAFECELMDLEAWAYLGFYFADKLTAGVALETFRRTGDPTEQARAIELLEAAAEHWEALVNVTETHYQPYPYVATGQFSWGTYTPETRRDIEIARRAYPEPSHAV
jgi:hypothetical protein